MVTGAHIADKINDALKNEEKDKGKDNKKDEATEVADNTGGTAGSPMPDGGSPEDWDKSKQNKNIRQEARKNGWKEVKDYPFNSRGQLVFKKGNKHYTKDIDGHKGGVWKQFDLKGKNRVTLDRNLNKVGK